MAIRVDSYAESNGEDDSGTEAPRNSLPVLGVLHYAIDGDAGLKFLKGPVFNYSGLREVGLDKLAVELEFWARTEEGESHAPSHAEEIEIVSRELGLKGDDEVRTPQKAQSEVGLDSLTPFC